MQKEEFINYLSEPAKLNEKSLGNIKELLGDYPYFQAAHLLLVKNLSNLNHLKFDSQLRLSAAYVGNRKLLFRLLTDGFVDQNNELTAPVSGEVTEPKELVTSEQSGIDSEKTLPEDNKGEKSIADIVLEQVAEMKQSLERPGTEKEETIITQDEEKSTEEFFEIDDKQEIISGDVPPDEIPETKSSSDLLVIDEQEKYDGSDTKGKMPEEISGKQDSEKSTQKKNSLRQRDRSS